MSWLLVNAPTDGQQIAEVGDGGGYFDSSLVLWDERVDGPLPTVVLGQMVRTQTATGPLLVADPNAPLAQETVHAQWLQRAADTTAAIQALLDSTAHDHGYDGIVSVISYAGSSIPKWNAEGLNAKVWRDACWFAAYQIQQGVLAGTEPLPSVASVLARMPAANWPTL